MEILIELEDGDRFVCCLKEEHNSLEQVSKYIKEWQFLNFDTKFILFS